MSHKKINITFMLPNLNAGGAERVMSFVAKEIDKDKFYVTLVIVGHERDASYDVSGIKVIYFGKPRVINGVISIFSYIKNNRPDIVVSAIEHLNTVVAYISLFYPKIKFVAREVNVLSVLHNLDKPTFNPYEILYKNRFRYFDAIICQSKDMLEDLMKHYKIHPDKPVIINNPITDGFIVKSFRPINNTLQLITVGRLAKQKGYDRILMALSQLKIAFHYTIIGKGPEQEHVYLWINEFNLKEKVTHVEFTSNVSDYLAKSDIYLQGSYVEGFPNALIESCAVGTPVIAFKAPGGLNEIIVEGVNGYVAENEKEFLNHIYSIHTNNTFVPNTVSESVYSKFNKRTILKQYEDLFLKLAAQ